MATVLNALLYIVAVTNFLLALVVLKSNTKKLENRLFAVFLFAAIFWAIGDALMLYADTQEIVRVGVIFFYAAPLLTTLFVVYFSLVFPNNRKLNPLAAFALAVPAAVYFVTMTVWPDIFLKSIEIYPAGQNIILHNKVPYQLYSLYFNVYFLLSYIFLIISYRRSQGVDKKRVSYALWSILLTSVAALFTNLTLPILGKNQYVFAGPMFLLFFAVVVTAGIIRHKLFDIRLVVARSLTYIFSLLSLAILYGFVAFYVTNQFILGSTEIDNAQRIILTVLAIVIAFTFQPIKRFYDRLTNRFFYQDAYDSQVLLDNLNRTLVSTIEIENLLSKSAQIIKENLKTDYVLFGLKEINNSPQRIIGTAEMQFNNLDIESVRTITPDLGVKTVVTDAIEESNPSLYDLLRKNDVAVLVRLTDTPKKKVEGIGYIVLGNKKSGSPFSGQDIKILEIIADELVIAIQNALRFEEIQKFNITLQQKVDDATKKLRAANKRLIELDQTKDDFISMASHQLRTPLTSIKGYVSMVMEGDAGKITKKQAELLDQAFVSSQRMVYLIADLLNVSRLRTGKFVIEPKKTNLADVIEGEISQLKETAKGRDLELTYKKPAKFPELMLDENKIRQVIMNFADNAIYYTPKGGHIEVKLEDTGDTIECTVEDDGIGVPKSEQHNLFNKFYRAGNAKKARPDGTGLGLFMAKKVVVAQGGSIIFKSQENKGSTFGFSFSKKQLLPENFKGISNEKDNKK